jgi:hypothetical protein
VPTLEQADEFIRRFLLHALPDWFHHIRHYGFLANRRRQTRAVPTAACCCWHHTARVARVAGKVA